MKMAVSFLLMGALLIFVLGTGCSRQKDDHRHPLYRQARHAKNSGDAAGAVAALRKALANRPNSVLYHLELAELYDEALDDPLNAAYHYQEALELAPDSPDTAQITAWCHAAQLRFISRHEELLKEAAAAAIAPEREAATQKYAALEAENAQLRSYVQTLKAALAAASARRPATPPPASAPSAPAPAPATAAQPVRRYTVQKGDTPGKIAQKFYHDATRFRPILEANRDTVKNERSLQVGTVLVIPPDPQNH